MQDEQGQEAFQMSDEDLENALSQQSQPAEQEEQQPEQTEETQEVTEPIEEAQEVETVEEEVEDKAVLGLRKEISKQREKRRALEAEMNILKGQVMSMQKPAEEAPKPPKLELGDDELVEGKTVKTLHNDILAMRQELEAQRQAFDARVQQDTKRKIDKCQEQARKDYSPEKVGEAYGYDKVIAEGFMPMLQADPTLGKRISDMENPAEEAYRLALAKMYDPIALISNQRQAKPAAKKSAPKTLGSAPAGGGVVTGDVPTNLSQGEIQKLSTKELDELMKKIK